MPLAWALVLVLGGGAFLLAGCDGPDANASLKQPLNYNHNVHVEKAGMSCTKCHAGAEKGARATFPADIYCDACHSSPRTGSAEEAKLLEMLENEIPLAWKQVTHIAPHVYFSHRRHVALGNIDCSACHGEMGQRTVPIEQPVVDFSGRAGMFRCIKCHRASGSRYARIDCVDCHR